MDVRTLGRTGQVDAGRGRRLGNFLLGNWIAASFAQSQLAMNAADRNGVAAEREGGTWGRRRRRTGGGRRRRPIIDIFAASAVAAIQLAPDTMVAVATPWVMSSCNMCEDRPGWVEGMGQFRRAGLQKYEKIFLSAFNEEFYNASLDIALQDAVRRGSPPCELRYESPSSVRSS